MHSEHILEGKHGYGAENRGMLHGEHTLTSETRYP